MNANNDAHVLTRLHARLVKQLEADAVLGDFHTALQAAAEIKAVAAAIRALSADLGEAVARAGDGDAVAWRTETPYGVGYLFADELIEAGACLEGKPPSPAESAEGVEYETRADGQRVRKDRWETGFRNIVTAIVGPRTEFEIPDIVERVRLLVEAAAPSEGAMRAAKSRETAPPEANATADAFIAAVKPAAPSQVSDAAFVMKTIDAAIAYEGDCAARRDLRRARGIIEAALGQPQPGRVEGWQPIDSMPADGSQILAYVPANEMVASMTTGFARACGASLWQPLPAAPTAGGDAQEDAK